MYYYLAVHVSGVVVLTLDNMLSNMSDDVVKFYGK
jgi:hypothetical protein